MAASTRRRSSNKGAGKKRKTSYSPERIAAAKARDNERMDRANEILSSPEFGARVMTLISGGAPSISRFSVRNQALLADFAEQAGRPLSQVATYGQWQEMGRQVRHGESAYLWVVRPVGREGVKNNDEAPADGDADSQEEGGRTKFAFMRVFDISQTDGIEDFEPSDKGKELFDRDANAINDPAATILAELTKQAERLDYKLELAAPGAGEHVTVIAESRRITLNGDPTPDALEELLSTVGALTADRARERRAAGEAAREARKAAEADGTSTARPQRASASVSREDGDVEVFTVI